MAKVMTEFGSGEQSPNTLKKMRRKITKNRTAIAATIGLALSGAGGGKLPFRSVKIMDLVEVI